MTPHSTPARTVRAKVSSLALILIFIILISPAKSASQAHSILRPPTIPGDGEICRAAPTALVLSGGGAWGLAHVGLIKALDELGIQPDFVVGTSMGAIIGAMYTAGFTGEEIEYLVLNLPLQAAFPGYRPGLPDPLDDLPVLFTMRGRPGEKLSLHVPLAQRWIIERSLRQSLSSRDPATDHDFSSLDLPFYVITTNIETRRTVVLSSGDLVQAVLASSALPFFFPPVVIDGEPLTDGGLSENIPVETARSLGAARVLVSDATSRTGGDDFDPDCQIDVISLITSHLFYQGPPELQAEDVLVRADLEGLPKLGFSRKQRSRFVQLGYEAAMKALSDSPCFSQNQVSDTPPNGPDATVAEQGEDTGLSELQTKLDSIMVQTPASTSEPWRFLGFGGAYRYGPGASAWIGLVEPNVFGSRAKGSAKIYAGSRTQGMELGLRAPFGPDSRKRVFLSVAGERREIPEFGLAGAEIGALRTRSISLKTGTEFRFHRDWTVQAGPVLEGWRDHEEGSFKGTLGGTVLMERGDPSKVHLRLEATWTGSFSRFATQGRWPFSIGSVGVTPYVRVGWGRTLPLHQQFAFGGTEGFPGLQLDEGWSSREALGGLILDQAIMGPIRLRLELASGMVRGPVNSLPENRWITGLGAGLGLDTFFGLIVVGYGWTDTGRRALSVSIGRKR